ncbi:MAG TPA: ABC transporter permease subunit [Gemmatimonadaceae bacterium]|nr:ABC transporter permease subunit [Gemmatimonadaceae bacterium]
MSGAKGVVLRIVQYGLSDVLRSRWLAAYALFFLVATEALLRFGGAGPRSLLALMNVILLVIPLVTVVFGTMYLYHAREFIELLLAQPVSRRQLFAGLYLGITIALAVGFVVGAGTPLAARMFGSAAFRTTAASLLGAGLALTAVFSAVALYLTVHIQDRVRGLGAAIGVWLGTAVLYDGLVLLLATMLADYPLERPLLGLMLANPVDLARVALLLQFDVSALMGYTGAVFESFFGTAGGLAVAALALAAWVAVPLWLGLRGFQRKDF